MKYDEPKPDEWVTPIHRGYKIACCDCGLVHDMDFRIIKGRKVQFRVRRNERSTAGMRRGKGLWKWSDGTWRTKQEKP